MLRIECPWCGVRNEDEFSYGGDATVERPADDASQDDWYDYVYTRANPAGPHHEYWHHINGCRAWLTVERDTMTHEIFSTAPASASLPQPQRKTGSL
ncbi:MAG TPA: sarcosine oxidase subunit delta [Gammaproteobacteria bacterium]|nr:sarcosine oxidase subunit delta [Gammaproteobacteria bacterium]